MSLWQEQALLIPAGSQRPQAHALADEAQQVCARQFAKRMSLRPLGIRRDNGARSAAVLISSASA